MLNIVFKKWLMMMANDGYYMVNDDGEYTAKLMVNDG